MNKSVIWDMDGVLVDTGELHYLAWFQTLPVFDIPFSYELFQKTFGMNNAGILTCLLEKAPTDEFLYRVSEAKETLFRELIHGKATLLPGVALWLEQLQQTGYTQAIASSAPQANIDALVDELNIRAWFNVIVSGFDLPGKPAPDTFLKSARLLGTESSRCIVVEDATTGVEGAKRAGMKCVAVTTTNPASLLQDADVVVENMTHLDADAFDRLLSE
jgi:beta-phosphoglucomutase